MEIPNKIVVNGKTYVLEQTMTNSERKEQVTKDFIKYHTMYAIAKMFIDSEDTLARSGFTYEKDRNIILDQALEYIEENKENVLYKIDETFDKIVLKVVTYTAINNCIEKTIQSCLENEEFADCHEDIDKGNEDKDNEKFVIVGQDPYEIIRKLREKVNEMPKGSKITIECNISDYADDNH